MNHITAFAGRNLREMMRDALSYVFCIGFPLIMLIIQSIPAQANMTVFHLENLTAGILMFGLTFVMLFTALTVSHDRAGTFLMRLYASPMTARDFALGYIVPMLLIAVVQALFTFAAAFVISWITGSTLCLNGVLLCLVTMLPSAVMYISIGLLFGTLFHEKSAPGLCSVIISLNSFLGCIFFDADSTGGVLLTVCKCLPFYYCTKSARCAISSAVTLNAENYWIPLLVVISAAVICMLLAMFAFSKRMLADLS